MRLSSAQLSWLSPVALPRRAASVRRGATRHHTTANNNHGVMYATPCVRCAMTRVSRDSEVGKQLERPYGPHSTPQLSSQTRTLYSEKRAHAALFSWQSLLVPNSRSLRDTPLHSRPWPGPSDSQTEQHSHTNTPHAVSEACNRKDPISSSTTPATVATRRHWPAH